MDYLLNNNPKSKTTLYVFSKVNFFSNFKVEKVKNLTKKIDLILKKNKKPYIILSKEIPRSKTVGIKLISEVYR